MVFNPNSNLINQSIGGGLNNANRLINLVENRRRHNSLAELGKMAAGGLNSPEDFNRFAGGLIGLGQIGQGVAVQNTPYNREQDTIQNEFRTDQLDSLNNHRDRTFNANEAQRAIQNKIALQKLATSRAALNQQTQSRQAKLEGLAKWMENSGASPELLELAKTNPKLAYETFTKGQTSGGAPKLTEGQANANIYATRMEASNAILDNLENEGTDFWAHLTGQVPLVGNYFQTPEYRQYEQAQRDFINATLRKESGAVISPEEFENGKKQYFPQPGDDPATIAQKRRNRITAMQSIREASGPLADKNSGGNNNEDPLGIR